MSDNGNRIDFNNLFNNNGYQGGYNQYGYQPPRRQSPQAMLSMIFGIASIIMCSSPFMGIGFGVMALVMRHIYHKSNPRCGMTKAGLICGIIGIVLSAIIFVVCLIIIMANPGILNELMASYGFTY